MQHSSCNLHVGFAFFNLSKGVKYTPKEWETLGRSRIFTFDFKHPEKNVREVNIVGESFDLEHSNFLGLSIWEDGDTG